MGKRKLNSASYIIARNFLHNIHRAILFAQPRSRATRAACAYAFLTIWPTTDILLVFIFCCANLFLKLYSVAWVGAISNMCGICLFMVFDGLPHVFSFVYEL